MGALQTTADDGHRRRRTHEQRGALAYTPELDTYRSATLLFDDDEFGPAFCNDRSVFEFFDDERLVQAGLRQESAVVPVGRRGG